MATTQFPGTSSATPEDGLYFSNGPQVFRVKKWTKIFVTIFSIPLIGLFVAGLLLPVISPQDNLNKVYWLVVLVSLTMIAIFIFALLDSWQMRLVIDTTGLQLTNYRGVRTLDMTDIKGYRIQEKHLVIETSNPLKKRIRLSRYLENEALLLHWLSAHFPDLDQVQMEEEKQAMLNDEKYGLTEEDRLAALSRARLVSRVLNGAGIAAGAWFLFQANEASLLTCILMPLLCLVVIRYFKGLIRINEEKSSPHPSVFFAVLIPSAVLALKAFSGFNLLGYQQVWMPAIVVTAVFMFGAMYQNAEFAGRKAVLGFMLLIFVFGYGFGSVVDANCILDQSTPTSYTATVVSKRISSGKTTTYYLELSPWGPQTETDETSVSKNFYQLVSEQDTVLVNLQQGRFKIPWYRLSLR